MRKEEKLLSDVRKFKQDRKKPLLVNYRPKTYLTSHGGGSLVEHTPSSESSDGDKKTSYSCMKVK